MINSLLIISIILSCCYAFYDQFAMDKLKGNTLFKMKLEKQSKIDAIILIGMISIIIYQTLPTINSLSLYLLFILIAFCIYAAFIRSPVFLVKSSGFFFANLFTEYKKIHAIHLTENSILVIDLKKGKRLLVRPENILDLKKIFKILCKLGVINKESESILNQLKS